MRDKPDETYPLDAAERELLLEVLATLAKKSEEVVMAKGTRRNKSDHVYETRNGVPIDLFLVDIKDRFGKRHRDKFKTRGIELCRCSAR